MECRKTLVYCGQACRPTSLCWCIHDGGTLEVWEGRDAMMVGGWFSPLSFLSSIGWEMSTNQGW